jgi:hypothetical protein
MLNQTVTEFGTRAVPQGMFPFRDLVELEISRFLKSAGYGKADIQRFFSEVETARGGEIAKDLYTPEVSSDHVLFLVAARLKGVDHLTLLKLNPGKELTVTQTIRSHSILNLTKVKLEIQKRMIERGTSGFSLN